MVQFSNGRDQSRTSRPYISVFAHYCIIWELKNTATNELGSGAKKTSQNLFEHEKNLKQLKFFEQKKLNLRENSNPAAVTICCMLL